MIPPFRSVFLLLVLCFGFAIVAYELPNALDGVAALISQTPGPTAGRAVLENQLRGQLGDVPFAIESFEKTNGEMTGNAYVKGYVLEYTATVHYPNGFNPECVGNSGDFKGWNCIFVLSESLSPGAVTPKSPGDTEIRKGQLAFEKTERGWRGEDGHLY